MSLIDIDECLEEKPCDINADCVNVDGSFGCLCRTGYSGIGSSCTGKLIGYVCGQSIVIHID